MTWSIIQARCFVSHLNLLRPMPHAARCHRPPSEAAGRAQRLQNSRQEQICYYYCCCCCSFSTEIIHHSANTRRNHMKNFQPKENDKSVTVSFVVSNNDTCCWGFDLAPKLTGMSFIITGDNDWINFNTTVFILFFVTLYVNSQSFSVQNCHHRL